MFSKSFQAQRDFWYGKCQLKQLLLGNIRITDPTSSGQYQLWLSQPPALLVILRACFCSKLHQYKSKQFIFVKEITSVQSDIK